MIIAHSKVQTLIRAGILGTQIEENIKSLIRDRDTMLVARSLLESPDTEINLETKTVLGYYTFQQKTGLHANSIDRALRKLLENGLLVKEAYQVAYACPHHNSIDIRLNLICPKCNGHRITRSQMIEHLACGHIGFEAEFDRIGSLVCPKEGKVLHQIGVDYIRPGLGYRCISCQEIFATPISAFWCVRGSHLLRTDELTQVDLYLYRANHTARTRLQALTFDLQPTMEALQSCGYSVKSSPRMLGMSGSEQRFDLLGTKLDRGRLTSVVIQMLVAEEAVDVSSIARLYSVLVDIRVTYALAICIPRIEDAARRQSKLFNIHCVEGVSPTNAAKDCLRILHATDSILPIVYPSIDPKVAGEYFPRILD